MTEDDGDRTRTGSPFHRVKFDTINGDQIEIETQEDGTAALRIFPHTPAGEDTPPAVKLEGIAVEDIIALVRHGRVAVSQTNQDKGHLAFGF